ncbi:lipid-binding protein [Mucilaginibacter litoreus]|uniref:Lipid-binding protein n=1 Tax=Mucilaginibacter litoreus TaxID=1048221 RepID=A0ABW3AMR0_9SPHI
MKKRNIIVGMLLATMGAASFSSCQKDEKIGGTAVQNLSGEYWIKIDNGADPTGTFDDSYYTISLYNTSSNRADSVWIDDGYESATGVPFWQIKGKIAADANNRTFSGTDIANQEYDSKFTIKNGKILSKAATAPGTKLKTDSIYFEIQFNDDPVPGTIHKVAGYARTRFDADDHY